MHLFWYMGTYSYNRVSRGAAASPIAGRGEYVAKGIADQKSDAIPLRSQSPNRVGSSPFGP